MHALSLLPLALLPLALTAVAAEPVSLVVDVSQPGAAPSQIGIFFEDINYGADGGLHPERIKNRSFEFDEPLMGWKRIGGSAEAFSVQSDGGLSPANPHFLRVRSTTGAGGLILENEGFFGIGVQKGAVFEFSLFARAATGGTAEIRASILAPDGQVLGTATLKGFAPGWKRHAVFLRANRTEAKARLRLQFLNAGTLDLDMVSLFPKDTWKNRPNGLRPDVVQLLADLKPAFMRFPGGCIVEGRHLDTRYQWKTTIGELPGRKLIVNRWNTEFKHRPAPDYFQSFGLGFFEYFQLCEDIGAEPLPILNCGMACQFNSKELAPLDQLAPYIQDALDLIEFANGPVTSPWGSKRAAMGHPKPFGMKLLGVGNEQWGPEYVERYARFAQVLKSKHPEVRLISSAGPRPDDDLYRFLWPKLRELKADIVDEHCYDRPAWFLDNAFRYDAFDRNGPKVFMGEYAAQSVKVVSPDNRNNWDCALAEAAFLTGLERNSAVVTMSSYAPLLAHEEGWQWRPNLIWFDNLRAYGSPSYYVQQLFSAHRGDAVLPVSVTGQAPPSSKSPGLYATATVDRKAGEVILKVVNSAPQARSARVELRGAGKVSATGTAIVLTGARLSDENSLAESKKVAPGTARADGLGATFTRSFPPQSLTVLRVKTSK